ncbi:unnamed protein product [Clonostachys byssicola]|uniref:Rho-GAP domain-containing protein n=1 Tax=Clonostachys byssicola TaxID=160290 RepID=A0A9N9YA15_9HYPO|nr:unnamed protein product [Clonostachys byssicola]
MTTAAGSSAAGPPAPLPQNTHGTANQTSPPTKRDLKSWWKSFKLAPKQPEQPEPRARGIFGVPLRQSITYANVAISLIDENGQSYIYGYVPIVVAKCGVFLKEKATGVEGIFRLSGSEKRIKELKTLFDSPDRYGKGLVWEGYTVHDAANVLRRYLNDLPEPVVPLDLYEKFRDPLRGATKQAAGDAEGPQFIENFDERGAIGKYQKLITELPPLNRQLLLYILDLLAVFAAKSDENRMNSQNLAAIFQPGMLSHPTHAMAPEEYRLNQCVIIFLIENQDHFLIGMQGTAADEATKKAVESGTPAATPKPITPTAVQESEIVRSSSNASAGAQSVRRDGQLRRNRSVHSHHSNKDDNSAPSSPALAATPSSGLGRSNTVPSKRSPAIGGKYRRGAGKSPSPQPPLPLTQAHPTEQRPEKPQSQPGHEAGSAAAPVQANEPVGPVAAAAGISQEHSPVAQHETTPQKERHPPNLYNQSPSEEAKKQSNKFRMMRPPGPLNPSAHSSNASLPLSGLSPSSEIRNPLEQYHLVSPRAVSGGHPPSEHGSHLHPDQTLRGKKSPPTSLHSSFNDGSDFEQGGDGNMTGSYDPEKEKKRRWRLSRTKNPDPGPGLASPSAIRSNEYAEMSTTSFGSASAKPRKSFTGDSYEPPTLVGSDSTNSQSFSQRSNKEKDEPRGPIGWIKSKMREAKENHEHRRNKSPPAAEPTQSILSPGKRSMDMRREPHPRERSVERHSEKPVEEKATPSQAAAQQPIPAQPTHVPAEQQSNQTQSATAHPNTAPAPEPKLATLPPQPATPSVQHTPPTPIVGQSSFGQPPVVRSLVDEALNYKPAAEKPAVEQSVTDKPTGDVPNVQHASADKPPVEPHTAEKTAGNGTVAQPVVNDKAPTEVNAASTEQPQTTVGQPTKETSVVEQQIQPPSKVNEEPAKASHETK